MTMRTRFTMLAAAIAACGGRAATPGTSSPSIAGAPVSAAPRTYGFDHERVAAPASGLVFARTGSGRAGRWIVKAEPSAPSRPNVLVQADDDDTDFRFPVAVSETVAPRDVRVSVSCRTISGRVDQACGMVLRYRDENNYYVTRANALEDNVRLYYVKDGSRHQLASWSGKVVPNAWHDYRIEARGERFEVFWDGERVLSHEDRTFDTPGRVGLWTKADSITEFDDLRVEAL